MRLSEESRKVIAATVHEVFGSEAKVCLFGSRLDDAQRGGDIDLLVELPQADADGQRKSLTCVARIQRRLGDQSIDLLVIHPGMTLGQVQKAALATGVVL